MKRFLLSLGLLLCCVTASFAQDREEYVSRDNPVRADINFLVKVGAIDDYESGMPRNALPTRYEIAVATARSLRGLGLLTKSGQGLSSSLPESPLLNQPEVVAAFKRLVIEFRPELKRMGVPVEQIKINGVFLIEPQNAQPKLPVAPPFADVPKNHWAYEAVEILRQAGIMVGIPAGDKTLFNSPNTK